MKKPASMRKISRPACSQPPLDRINPELDWDETREDPPKMSGQIVRTTNITQSAVGNKDGLWTTCFRRQRCSSTKTPR